MWVGLKLAGKDYHLPLPSPWEPTGDGLPEVPIEVGAVRPQESPGLEVCEIPQIARF